MMNTPRMGAYGPRHAQGTVGKQKLEKRKSRKDQSELGRTFGTHKSPQERKPNLKDGHNAKLASGGENDAECSGELIGVVLEGVESVSEA
jgi:hypothetical protein